MNTLYPFQKVGVEHILSRRNTLLADEQGLGKTIQAISALNQWRMDNPRSKYLIVCPAGLRQNWFQELDQWLEKPARIYRIETSKSIIPKEADIVISSYQMSQFAGVTVQLKQIRYQAAIFDEAHYLQSTKSITTKFFLGHMKGNYEKALCMTGTPVRNFPINFYPILRTFAPEVIAPHLTKLKYGVKFCSAYCDPNFGWIFTGTKNAEELHERVTKSGFMLRRLKRDVLPDLPPRIWQILPLDKDLVKGAAVEVNKSLDFPELERKIQLGQDLNISTFSEARQIIAQYKFGTMLEMIRDILKEKRKLVVFAYHNIILDGFRNAFRSEASTGEDNFKPVFVRGHQTTAKKQASVDAFQNDPNVRILFAQIQAGGVGFTLTAASTILFVEASWCPADIMQAVDRCHRIGQDEPVTAIFPVVRGTLEEFVLATAVRKIRNIEKIVDGHRPISLEEE